MRLPACILPIVAGLLAAPLGMATVDQAANVALKDGANAARKDGAHVALKDAANATEPPPPRRLQADDERTLNAEAAPMSVRALRAAGGARARIVVQPGSGRVRFFDAGGEGLEPAAPWESGADPERAARAFLRAHGAAFGVGDAPGELRLARVQHASPERSFVRFQQEIAGLPVLAGELIVQVDGRGRAFSTIGRLASDAGRAQLAGENSGATLDPEVARQIAIEAVAKSARSAPLDTMTARSAPLGMMTARSAPLEADAPRLFVFDPSLLGLGPPAAFRVYRVVVTSPERLDLRSIVLVDAVTGALRSVMPGVASALSEEVWDNANLVACGLPGCQLVRSTGQGATGMSDADDAFDFADDTYAFYHARFGRDGIDDQGLPLISTVRYCEPGEPCPYANAFWNGAQMVYGEGFASADDVVAHELTHGITERESGLVYAWESGAINESLSDIFGELVDLTNGRGTDWPAVRWLLGEDLPNGAIRSLANPPSHGQPDRISSPLFYCGNADGGGVHINDGVGNKIAALIADGGTFGGMTVAPIGLSKTARLYYELATHWLVSGSDYRDLYDGLYAACASLIGTGGMTSSDCIQVDLALIASETHQEPPCGNSGEAQQCPNGGSPVALYTTDFEDGCAGWNFPATVAPANSTSVTGAWFCGAPAPFGRFAASGTTSLYGLERNESGLSDVVMTGDVVLPNGASYMHFRSAFQLEADLEGTGYDGGVLEYSVDGGESWLDAGELFEENGYNGVLDSGTGNPLGGRSAFTGSTRGYGSSRLDLSSLAGQSIRFRFRIATDDGTAGLGWYVDDLSLYTCEGDNPVPRIDTMWPRTIQAGTESLSLIVNGAGFVPSSTVRWDGSERPTSFVSPTQLTAAISGADLADPNDAAITVLSPAPGGGLSNAESVIVAPACGAAHATYGFTYESLTEGDCALEALVPGRRYDRYTLTLTAGHSLTIRADASAFAPSITVVFPDGTSMTRAECGRKRPGACLTLRPVPQTGEVSVIVTSVAPDGRGHYSLKLTHK